MLGVGFFVVWIGYSLGYYGVDQVRGGNNGLLSLMIPGKYTNQPTDKGSSTSAIASADSAAAVALQKLQASQTASSTGQAGAGGAGTGVTTLPGGISVVRGTQGQVSCIDKNGNIVPCPAGTT